MACVSEDGGAGMALLITGVLRNILLVPFERADFFCRLSQCMCS